MQRQRSMRHLLELIYVALALAACHGQFIYPDRFESMKLEAERGRPGKPYSPQRGFGGGFRTMAQQPPWRQASAPVASASFASTAQNHLSPRLQEHVVNVISRGVTKFTLDMDRVIDETSFSSKENLVFSPISLTVTLAMVLLASGGRTFQEVARVLGLESGLDIHNHSELVHEMFGLLIQQFDQDHLTDNTAPQCKVAFGIFLEEGYPIRKEFRSVSDKIYKSDTISVDFLKEADAAKSIINNWVNEKTMGKIKQLLSEPPNPSSAVIIASALYFSGEWNQHFNEATTRRRPFYVEPNETIYVDLMFTGGPFPFYEDKNLPLKIIALPYKGLKISMYVILPSEKGSSALRKLKRSLTPDRIDGLISKMDNRTCIVGLPKMKLSSTLKLQRALESLGLRSLFDARTADLSILSPGRGHGPDEPSFISWRSFEEEPRNSGDEQPSPRPFSQGRKMNPWDRLTYRYSTENYTVEQWSNGYSLRYLPRIKRQSERIDWELLELLKSQDSAGDFGVDELRNSPGLRNPGLYADDVIHKVEMTVDERGTEAAAVTGVLLDRSGDVGHFVANRPFLFFIRHDVSKLIWFWGSINQPAPNYRDP